MRRIVKKSQKALKPVFSSMEFENCQVLYLPTLTSYLNFYSSSVNLSISNASYTFIKQRVNYLSFHHSIDDFQVIDIKNINIYNDLREKIIRYTDDLFIMQGEVAKLEYRFQVILRSNYQMLNFSNSLRYK